MTTEMCRETYRRPAEVTHGKRTVECTFIEGHPARHSWESLKIQDACDLEAQRASTDPALDDLPPEVVAILDNITEGHADPYLEAILAVTHNRKRALRNVPGFARRDR